MRRLPVHIWISEENAVPGEMAGYFIELARRLDEHPQKMRLIVESTVPAILDFDPSDGNPIVSVGGKAQKFDVRRRWLPDHPVPLEFGPRTVVLLIDPVDGNRFRVRSGRRINMPRWVYALFAATATLAVVTLHLAAVSAAATILAAIGIVAFCKRSVRKQ